jgi:hypothetical protein
VLWLLYTLPYWYTHNGDASTQDRDLSIWNNESTYTWSKSVSNSPIFMQLCLGSSLNLFIFTSHFRFWNNSFQIPAAINEVHSAMKFGANCTWACHILSESCAVLNLKLIFKSCGTVGHVNSHSFLNLVENDIFQNPFHSIYGATAPSAPWPPSEDTSILLSSAHLLHPCITQICDVYLRTDSHLVLGLPTGLVLWNFPLTFWHRNFIFKFSHTLYVKCE